MLKSLSRFLLFVLCFLATLHQGISSESPSRATIARLKDSLAKNAFKNLCFDFTIVESKKTAGQKNFSITGWDCGKMWLNGKPNSLVKVTYAPCTTLWEGGGAPYYQENKTIAYNGKYWICEITDSGAVDAMTHHPEAVVTGSCPNDWSPTGWSTGEVFFVTHAPFSHFQPDNINPSVTQVVKNELSWPSWLRPFLPGPALRVTEDNDIIKISMEPSNFSPEIWLDMQKGGALKKLITKHKESTEEITVESYKEVNGIWFPVKGTRVFKSATHETKMEFTASNFTLIDSDQGLYEVKLDPKCHVENKLRSLN